MNGFGRGTPRRPASRGQAVPAGYMPAPEVLGPRGRTIWEEIQRSRPNFYAECDRVPLMMYCAALGEVEAVMRAETEVSGARVDELYKRVMRLGQALRITPQARAEADAAVIPKHGQQVEGETDEDFDRRQGANNAPWRAHAGSA